MIHVYLRLVYILHTFAKFMRKSPQAIIFLTIQNNGLVTKIYVPTDFAHRLCSHTEISGLHILPF